MFLTKWGETDLLEEGDAIWYSYVAINLARGGELFVEPFAGTPTASHPPLTVVLLSVTSLFSMDVLAHRLTMTVVGALAVGAIGLLGRDVGGPRVGLVAAGIAAVAPDLFVNQSLVMSEALATLLYALLLLVGLRLARTPTARLAVTVGAVCGLTILTRAEAGLFLPLMIVPVLLTRSQLTWRERVVRIGLAVGAAVAVVAPWAAFNTARFEEPVLVSTNDGGTLAGANCDEAYYSSAIGAWSVACATASLDPAKDESQNSAQLRRNAMEYVGDNADRVPMVAVARVGRTFGLWRPDQMMGGEGRPELVAWAGQLFFLALVPVAIVGAARLRGAVSSRWPFVAALATPVIVSLLFNGNIRHRLPLEVAMCVLVAVAVSRRPRSRYRLTTRPSGEA